MSGGISRRRLAGIALVAALSLGAAFLVGLTIGYEGGGSAAPSGSGADPPVKSAEGFAVLPTHRCPTELAIGQPYVPVAPRVTVPLSASQAEGLALYSDSVGTTLVGPKGWECRATMGADGSELIGVVSPGTDRAPWSVEPGSEVVLAEIVPACAGCMSTMICAFFPHADVVQTYAAYEDCPRSPAGENSFRVSRSAVVFVDPAEVEGAGAGSGGASPSSGVVAFSPRFGARRISCTLPAPMSEACAGIVTATLTMSS